MSARPGPRGGYRVSGIPTAINALTLALESYHFPAIFRTMPMASDPKMIPAAKCRPR
jgi:hypothetical protein